MAAAALSILRVRIGRDLLLLLGLRGFLRLLRHSSFLQIDLCPRGQLPTLICNFWSGVQHVDGTRTPAAAAAECSPRKWSLITSAGCLRYNSRSLEW